MNPRTRRSLLALGAVLITLGGALASSSPASARPPQDAARRPDPEVQAVLDQNPGARQINEDQVELEPGVVVTRPGAGGSGGDVSVQGTGACDSGYLCFWEHANFEGWSIGFYFCRQYDLRNYRMPNGNDWAYDISSWNDRQTGSAYGTLWGGGGEWLARTNQPDYNPWVGLPVNDRAVSVIVC